jgi:uncharacterized protein
MRKLYNLLWSTMVLTILMPVLGNAQAKLVISQVYGGGGNSGAPFNRDFVEIFNAGTVTANLTGLTLQYASATGTGNFGANSGQLVSLTGSLAPGQYYLIGLAGGSTGANLPTPDASGTIAMAAGAGKVALVNGTSSLGCNGGSAVCDPTQLARIIDLVGYGNANFFEGSGAAPTLSNTTAAFRAGNGCTDTDNNSADFTSAAPNPRNAASPVNLCFVPEPILVISQVYGAGGNTGATLNRDYVEIFNRGTGPADLSELSIQYTSATGTGNFGANSGQLLALSGTLQPGQYYLAAMAGGANGAALPTPDATGTIAMAAGAGKVALVTGPSSLGCNGSSTPCNATQLERIIDLVGYGNANFFEGSGAAPTISTTTAAFRLQNGCTDTDNNAADFVTGTPAPRNTASPFNNCPLVFSITTSSLPAGQVLVNYNASLSTSAGAIPVTFSVETGNLPPGITLGTDGTFSGTPTTTAGSPFGFTVKAVDANGKIATRNLSIVINPAPVCNPTVTIAEVQGEGITSPLLGNNVTISGIVTGRKGNGYFIQMAEGDGNPNTSDALFVFTSSAPPVFVQQGNELCITGSVFEFVSSLDPGGRTLTQLTNTTAFVTSTGNALPAPIVLTAGELSPDGGLDQLEKFENMRVTVPSLTVVAPTQGNTNEIQANASSNGFFYGVITGTPRPFREPGIQEPLTAPVGAPATVERWDGNPELLGVASSAQPGNTSIDVAAGDVVINMTGPLDFLRKYFVINADGTGNPEVVINNPGGQALPDAEADELTVASYNIERFFDDINDPAIGEPIINPIAFDNRLNKAALGIINLMRMPDVIGFQEIENLSTLQALANRVNQRAVEAGFDNPQYVAYLEEGNDPGGIDVGFMVKTTRVQVTSVTQFGKNTTFTNPTTGNQDILNDRPPLVLKANFLNPTECQPPVPFIVISNHLRSLNGNEDLVDGRVRTKRLEQANFLGELINDFTAENPDVKLINLGDFNAFEFNDGYVDIVGTVKGTPVDASLVVLPSPVVTNPALINLVDGVNPTERYSYNFFGSAQHLDHVMVNPNMYQHVTRFIPVHFNADYPQIFRGDFSRPERISDHDPLVAYFKFTPPPPPTCNIEAVPANNIFTGGVPTNIYLGYGPQSVTLVPTATNGTTFTYEWSGAAGLSCTSCESPVFAPTAPGVYTITATVTNENNCSSTCEITICVADIRVPGSNGKVYVCHAPNGNPANRRTLEVSTNAVPALLGQSVPATLGTCGTNPCTPANVVRTPAMLKSTSLEASGALRVQVGPNPSAGAFLLQINSGNAEPVQVKITDLSGRVLSEARNLQPNATYRTGENLSQGMYFAEVIQNRQKVVLKLIKTN